MRGQRIERRPDRRETREGIVTDDRRDLIRRPEIPVILKYDEVIGVDLTIGAEGDRDVDVAVEKRLVLEADRDVADARELKSAILLAKAGQTVGTIG